MRTCLAIVALVFAAFVPSAIEAQQNELLDFSSEFAEEFLASREPLAPAQRLENIAFSGVRFLDIDLGDLSGPGVMIHAAGEWQTVEAADPRLDTRKVINAEGQIIVPGLIEHHAHLAEFMMDPATLFVANGVTGVVNLSGSEALLQLASDPRLLRLPLPVIETTGPFLQGEESIDAKAACAIAQEHEASGFAGIKFYQEDMSDEEFSKFLTCATTLGIPVYGHLPEGVDIAQLVGSPFIVAHAEEFLGTRWDGHEDWLFEPGLRREAAHSLARGGTGLIPNLSLYRRIIAMQNESEYEAMLTAPEMEIMPEIIRQLYGPGNPYRSADDDEGARKQRAERLAKNLAALEAFTREFDRAGGLILLGSDAPNPMAIYGKSMIEEMLSLQAAGLPRLQILRLATGAHSPHDFAASWVLLDANPLEDLSAYDAPRAVILRDNYWSAQSIALQPPD